MQACCLLNSLKLLVLQFSENRISNSVPAINSVAHHIDLVGYSVLDRQMVAFWSILLTKGGILVALVSLSVCLFVCLFVCGQQQ